MSNELIPQNFGAISTKFQNTTPTDDLSSGIQSSFGLIGYKGKVWSIRYRGDEQQLMRDDGDGPRGSIEVVIVKAATAVSKIWYEHGYVEGSNAAPDCFSNNGVTPDPTSAKKQSEACATCPHNAWGSRITPGGKAGKACSDSKRLAVVPMGDVANEAFGGPMLLRVPAASLQDLAMYGQKMQHMGYPYYAIATRIKFDPAESYPKFVFGAIRPLTDDEADVVLTHRDSHTVQRILSENEFAAAPAAEQAATESVFEQPPQPAQQAAAQTQAQPAQQEAPKQEAPKQEAKTEAPATTGFGAAKPVTTKVTEPEPEAPAEEAPAEEESDTDREARELEEKLREIKAKKAAEAAAKKAAAAGNGAATTTQATQTAEPAPTQDNSATASPSEVEAPASKVEMDLDAELDKLLGAG